MFSHAEEADTWAKIGPFGAQAFMKRSKLANIAHTDVASDQAGSVPPIQQSKAYLVSNTPRNTMQHGPHAHAAAPKAPTHMMSAAMTALLSLPRVISHRFSRSRMTVTKKRFSCSSCMLPLMDPMAQQSVLSALHVHLAPASCKRGIHAPRVACAIDAQCTIVVHSLQAACPARRPMHCDRCF